MAKEEDSEILVEEGEERMTSPNGLRIGKFLKPCARDVKEVAGVPPLFHLPEKWHPPKILFRGSKIPQTKWKSWVDRMTGKYEPLWRKTGIFDAVMSSTYEIRLSGDSIVGFLELWCSETNTFILPFGEATMTLEDMMILGGFPVLGKPITAPLIEEKLVGLEEEMVTEHKSFNRSKAKKATDSEWLNRFMDSESQLEHIAFLSLWLSRCVFPIHPDGQVRKNVFSIAIHLGQGIRVALAPAVLANTYRDLSLLKHQVIESSVQLQTPIVWAPFQILQMWIWERFLPLRPGTPHSLKPGEPRSARWHKLKPSMKLSAVRSRLKLLGDFQWRPYSACLNNWRIPCFYMEREELLEKGSCNADELQSFCRCLRACELIGLDCIVQYLPHRIAMQFGMDQDLPGKFTRDNSVMEVAWSTYDKPTGNAQCYVRSRFVEPSATARYSVWWKLSMTRNAPQEQSSTLKKSLKRSRDARKRGCKKDSSGVPSKRNNQNLEDSGGGDDDMLTISQVLQLQNKKISTEKMPVLYSQSQLVKRRLFHSHKEEDEIENNEASSESIQIVDGNQRKADSHESVQIVDGKQRKAGDSIVTPVHLCDNGEKFKPTYDELESRISELEKEMARRRSSEKVKAFTNSQSKSKS